MSSYTPAVVSKTIKALAKAMWKQSDPTYLLSPNQAELCSGIDQAVSAQQRHVVFRCSRRWGKSWTMVIYALKMCLQNPNYKVQYVAGTIKLVRRVVQPMFKDVFGHCPVELHSQLLPKWNQQLGQYEFPNGSIIVIGGADNNNIDDLLGQAAHLIIVDEAGYIKVLADAVGRVLGPMLATTKGTMIVASTPPKDPTHFFHTLCAQASTQGYLFHRDIFTCDTGLVDVELEKKSAGGENSQVWRREWLALPTLDHDYTVFPEFLDLKKEIVRPVKRPDYFSYYSRYVILDYGFSPDATAILFAYYDFAKATIFIEDEVLISRMSTDTLARVYQEKKRSLWDELPVYLELADAQANILEDLYERHKLNFNQMTDKGAGSVLQNANNTNIMLRERRLVIDPRCVNLIAQMECAQWEGVKKNSQKRELARSDIFQHFDAVAALLYLVKSVNYTYNPVPRYPGYDPMVHVSRDAAAAVHTTTEVSMSIQDIFGGMVKLGKG